MQLYRLLAIGGLIAALGLTTVLTVKGDELSPIDISPDCGELHSAAG